MGYLFVHNMLFDTGGDFLAHMYCDLMVQIGTFRYIWILSCTYGDFLVQREIFWYTWGLSVTDEHNLVQMGFFW